MMKDTMTSGRTKADPTKCLVKAMNASTCVYLARRTSTAKLFWVRAHWWFGRVEVAVYAAMDARESEHIMNHSDQFYWVEVQGEWELLQLKALVE